MGWDQDVAAQSEAALPAVRLDVLEPVSPDEADAYFQALGQARMAVQPALDGPAAVTSGLDGLTAAQTVPDVVELARALRNDIDLMYEYVHDNIAFTPTFGLKKAALGVLLDGSGNAFDQTNLFVQLARQAGYQAEFVKGTIRLSETELNEWLGSTGNRDNGANILGDGGIPIDPCCGNAVRVGHIWARVMIGGTFYHFDPALKKHQVLQPMANLASVMGYSATGTGGLLTEAGGTISGGAISGLNDAKVEAELNSYAANLVDHLRANNPAARFEDVVGGLKIIPHSGAFPRDLDHPKRDLAYTATPWSGEILDEYRTKISFTDATGNSNADCFPNGEIAFFTDELDGKRLTVSVEPTFLPGGQPASPMMVMRLDNVDRKIWITSGAGGNFRLNTCINHPYANSGPGGTPNPGSRGPADQIERPLNMQIEVGYTYNILNGWGNTGRGRVEYHRKRLREFQDQGIAATDERVIGESLALNGVIWLAHRAAQRRINNGLHGLAMGAHNEVGISGQRAGPYVDIPISQAIVANRSDASASLFPPFFADTGLASGFEASVIEQTTSAAGVATVSLFDSAVRGGMTFFEVTSNAGLDAITNQLANYSTSDLNLIRNYLSSNFRVIMPQNGSLTIGQWNGQTFIATKSTSTTVSAGYIISGAKGGFSSVPTPPPAVSRGVVTNAVPAATDGGWVRSAGKLVSDPVNIFTGDYYLETTDLTVGSGPFPHGLGFQRSYNSGARLANGALGRGWSHNYDIAAQESSDGLQGMGEDSPLDAVGMIAAIYVTNDLIGNSTALRNVMVATLVQDWAINQIIDNAVTVTKPGSNEMFIKLPAGRGYNPPSRSAAQLTKPTATTFKYESKAGVTLDFNSNGELTRWKDANDFKVSLSYAGGRLERVTNDFGWALDLVYTGDRITSVLDEKGRSISFAYHANGNLHTFTDAEGAVTNYIYDPNAPGRMTEIRYPSFPGTAFVKNVYDGLGRVKEQTNFNTGPSSPYVYYVAGTRSEEVDPLGQSRVWYFDGLGNELQEQDKLDRVTDREYDGLGRLTRLVLPEGNSIDYTYDDATCYNTADPADPDTNRCTHNVQTITRTPDATRGGPTLAESFTYRGKAERFKVHQATDARGKTTTYTYDGAGNVLTITQPDPDDGGPLAAPVTTMAYITAAGPRKGFLEQATDPTGRVVRYEYNASNGNLEAVRQDPNGLNLQTIYTYDTFGNVASVTDPEGRITNNLYDCERRVRAIIPPAPGGPATVLPTVRTDYDADGRERFTRLVTGTTSGLQCNVSGGTGTILQSTELRYFDNGQLKEEVSADGVSKTSYQYDKLDRLIRVTDPELREVHTEYDAAGQTTVVRAIKGSFNQVVSRYEYNDNGVRTAVRDANDSRTEYVYDGHDRLLEARYPSLTAANTADPNDRERFAYDNNGNVITRWTRANQAITLTNDNLNRLIARQPTGGQKVEYVYDGAGRQTKVRYTTGDAHSIEYSYDGAGRLKCVADRGTFSNPAACTSGDGARVVRYGYDDSGNRTELTWPDGVKVSYHYDGAGRIAAIREGAHASPGSFLVEYSYDSRGRRQQVDLWGGSAVETTYGYEVDDALALLIHDVAGTTASINDVTYDQFQYFADNRIKSMRITNAAYRWQGHYNQDTAISNNRRNQPTRVGMRPIEHDANGNLTSDLAWRYSYDTENRLTEAKRGGVTATYLYDPQGKRSRKTVTSRPTTDFLYDGGQVIADYHGSTIARRYVWGPGIDEPVAMYEGSGTSNRQFYLTDWQGSIIGMVGTNGALLDNYGYAPYGRPDDELGNPYRFTGQRFDEETGLYYYKARYYSPLIGRFLSPDPLGYADGLNLYAYVGNDPVNFTDSTGELANFIVGGGVSVLIGGATRFLTGQKVFDRNAILADAALGAAGVGVVSATKNLVQAVRAGRGIHRSRALGKVGERAVGISQPGTKGIRVPETGKVRFPDRVTPSSIDEVKNVATIGRRDAAQIRDLVGVSQPGQSVNVFVRSGANTSRIDDLIRAGQINVKPIPNVGGSGFGIATGTESLAVGGALGLGVNAARK